MVNNRKKGYTLIEVITVIAVFTLVITVVLQSIVYFYQTNRGNVEQALAVESVRKGVEYTVRDIRSASFSEQGSFPIEEMSSYSFTFYGDVIGDMSVEKVRFFIEDGKLKRGVTEAVGNPPEYIGEEEVVTVISEEIENVEEEAPVFSFFNEEGEEEDSIYDVRYVRVYVVIAAEDDKQLILQSGAALRVLRNLY